MGLVTELIMRLINRIRASRGGGGGGGGYRRGGGGGGGGGYGGRYRRSSGGGRQPMSPEQAAYNYAMKESLKEEYPFDGGGEPGGLIKHLQSELRGWDPNRYDDLIPRMKPDQ